MIRHLALYLITLMLAAPAIAAPLCHEVPAQSAPVDHAAMGHGQHDEQPLDEKSPKPIVHGCIGCAAPAPALPAPTRMVIMAPTPIAIVQLESPDGLAIRPALRPPRA